MLPRKTCHMHIFIEPFLKGARHTSAHHLICLRVVSSKIVTGFAKRGLPHTSNSLNLEDHNLPIEWQMELKLPPVITLCWHVLLTKFQVSSLYQPLWIVKVGSWMCVEDPFSQIRSQLCFACVMCNPYYVSWL